VEIEEARVRAKIRKPLKNRVPVKFGKYRTLDPKEEENRLTLGLEES
jgi:hypothetical protein